MKLPPLLFALLFPAVAFADVQFNGVVVSGNKVQVSLYDTVTQDSNWVRVPGGKFGTYTVTGYHAAATPLPPTKVNSDAPPPNTAKDTITITKSGGRPQTIALNDSVLQTTPVPSIVPVVGAPPGQVVLNINGQPVQPVQGVLNVNGQPVQAVVRTINVNGQPTPIQPGQIIYNGVAPTGAAQGQLQPPAPPVQ